MKQPHQRYYSSEATGLCERTLVTLMRGLGPWKTSCTLAGGLVPRYLAASSGAPGHAGTSDVDLVLDFSKIEETEAYRRFERNLQGLGFSRDRNEEGEVRHFRWVHQEGGVMIGIDLLCPTEAQGGGRHHKVPRERRLSALGIPGAHLAIQDRFPVEITAELLDGRGTATETIQVAGLAPFVVMKVLAYEDRFAEKDAYDIVYCLLHYGSGPSQAGLEFQRAMVASPEEPLFQRALDLLRSRFCTDTGVEGYTKDGPTSYARFLDDGNRPLFEQNRRTAHMAVEEFIQAASS